MQTIRLRQTFALALLMIVFSTARAQTATDPCRAVTVADVAVTGAKQVTKLEYDPGSVLNKAAVPGLPTDLRTDQCIGPILDSNAVTFRLSVLRARDSLDGAGWAKVDKALDDEKRGANDTRQLPKLGAIECDEHRWDGGSKAKPVPLFETYCSSLSAERQVVVSFEHHDKAQIPPAAAIKALLEKVLSRP